MNKKTGRYVFEEGMSLSKGIFLSKEMSFSKGLLLK